MLARQVPMIDTIRQSYELYGIRSVLSTPAIEVSSVLSASAGARKRKAIDLPGQQSQEEAARALRLSDLTVPLARVIAHIAISPAPLPALPGLAVWRAEQARPKAASASSTQFDLDSVGTEDRGRRHRDHGPACATAVGARRRRYLRPLSSRAMLNLLADFSGISAEQGVDRLSRSRQTRQSRPRQGSPRELLKRITRTSQATPSAASAWLPIRFDRIKRFLEIKNDNRREVVTQLRALFAGLDHAAAMPPSSASPTISTPSATTRPCLARSLHRPRPAYYTGPVFEAILLDAPQFGSLRRPAVYDDLVMRFLGEKIPAVGHRWVSIASWPPSPTSGRVDPARQRAPSSSRTWTSPLTDEIPADDVGACAALASPPSSTSAWPKRLGKQLSTPII